MEAAAAQRVTEKHKGPVSRAQERAAKRGAARQENTSMLEALQGAKVEDVLAYMRQPLDSGGQPFVHVNASDSMTAALSVLAENKVHGAPIYDAKEKKYIGFIDSIDIMAAAIEIFEASGDHAHTEKDSEADDAMGRRLQEELMIAQLNAKALSDCSRRNPWVTFPCTTPLQEIALRLSQPDVHRVGVEDASGKLIGVITQSALCEFLFEEHYDILQHMKERVKNLDLPKQALTISENEEVLVAFQLMLEKKVSGLVVVNELGIATDSISHSDMTLWNQWTAGGVPLRFLSLEKLHKSVHEFLESTRAENQSNRKRGMPVTCKYEDKLDEVLARMLEHNVHRSIVVDDDNHPLSVVSFGNILKLFCHDEKNSK